MIERFTPNLIKCISLAQSEASRAGKSSVSPTHLLLGLLCLSEDSASELLHRFGANTIPGLGEVTTDDIPFDDDSKLLIESSWKQAQERGDAECSTQHLLLALLRTHNKEAREVLEARGVNLLKLEASLFNGASDQIKDNDVVSDPETLRAKISTWQNRAEMARQQGQDDLVATALEHKRKYEKLLADLN